MSVLLRVNQLSTEYVSDTGHAVSLLKHISFDLNSGEILGVIGESGSGKTTLALSILGLLPFKKGRIKTGHILFKGNDILSLHETELQKIRGNRIAIIFQEPFAYFNPSLGVGEQVAEPLRLHREATFEQARHETIHMLLRCGIENAEVKFNALPMEWSGGQLQRAMIAMALLTKPDLIIADEPSSALDPVTQESILNILREEATQRGMGLILITHNVPRLKSYADHIAVLYGGEIMEYTTQKQFFEKPRHPYSVALSQCFVYPTRWKRLHVLEGQSFHFGNVLRGCPFANRCAFKSDLCVSMDSIPLQKITNTAYYQCILENE